MRRPATRRLKVVLTTATVALALLVFGAVPALAFDRQANENTMLRLINNARTSRGLHAVRSYEALHKAARAHSGDMLRRDYFAHSSLSGLTVSSRARRAGYSVNGWSAWSVGEVIAWGSGARGTPQAIFRAWMNSGGHRSIILTRRWRDVGVGCSRGTFKGISGVCMWTVDVGRRVQ
jgi:uncharacterized protein YkwD